MMSTMNNHIIWFMDAFAAQSVVFCGIGLIILRRATKLHTYVKSVHLEYYERNLAAPLYAGNKEIFDMQFRAVKNTYFGPMPDERSRYYQKRLRRVALLSLVVFASALITLLISVIVSILNC